MKKSKFLITKICFQLFAIGMPVGIVIIIIAYTLEQLTTFDNLRYVGLFGVALLGIGTIAFFLQFVFYEVEDRKEDYEEESDILDDHII